ncbi:MAG: hypothetical protein ACYTEL_21495 [Planctomycetota bacterium]|jgi:hypothetical protein
MMTKEALSLLIAVAFGMLSIGISGCATDRVDLVKEGIVSVQTVPSKKVKILWTDVYQDGGDTVVYGALQRRSHTSYPLSTHVDIGIISPDGTTLHEIRTPDIHVARRIPGKGINWTSFRVRIPGSVPKRSKIEMVVHYSRHEDET